MKNNMKTRVIIKSQPRHEDGNLVGMEGYIDGYIRGGDDTPYVVVIVGDRIVLAKPYELTIICQNHEPTTTKN